MGCLAALKARRLCQELCRSKRSRFATRRIGVGRFRLFVSYLCSCDTAPGSASDSVRTLRYGKDGDFIVLLILVIGSPVTDRDASVVYVAKPEASSSRSLFFVSNLWVTSKLGFRLELGAFMRGRLGILITTSGTSEICRFGRSIPVLRFYECFLTPALWSTLQRLIWSAE